MQTPDELSEALEPRAEEFALTLYPDATKDGKALILDAETRLFVSGLKAGQVHHKSQIISLFDLAAIAKGTEAAALIHSRRFLGLSHQSADETELQADATNHAKTATEPENLEQSRNNQPVSRKERPNYGQRNGSYLPDLHRTLPHSTDAEQGVLGSMLISPNEVIPQCIKHLTPEHFHIPRHALIFGTLTEHWREVESLDFITLTQLLIDKGQILQIAATRGDAAAFITNLFTFVPTAANAGYYIEIVREKYTLRKLISSCTDVVHRAYNDQDQVAEIMELAKVNLQKIDTANTNDVESFSFRELMAFDGTADPDNLLGKRWICRGHTCLWAGGAGFGKSTFMMQAAIYWGNGIPMFGINPYQPRKSLIIQAENDLGDTGEQFQGVMEGIMDFAKDFNACTPEEIAAMIQKNVIIKRVISSTGPKFCSILDSLIKEHQPDMVWIDPLFAFAGIDLKEQAPVSTFLREHIMPIAVRNKCAIMVIHHIGKPDKDSSSKAHWTDLDFQYLGFGSSEIQNSFRAVNIILPVSGQEKTFRLILSKRGSRAGALSLDEDCTACQGTKRYENGQPCPRCQGTGRNVTNNLYLQHSERGIHWMQIPKPEQQDDNKPGTKTRFKPTGKCTPEVIIENLSPANPIKSTALAQYLEQENIMSERSFWNIWRTLAPKGKPCDPRIERKGDGWIRKIEGVEL